MEATLNNEYIDIDNNTMSLALYGYACFTAMAVVEGKVKGFNHHLERLIKDSGELFGISPSKAEIKSNLNSFLTKHKNASFMIARVTIFPKDFSIENPEKINGLNIMVTGRAQNSVSENPLNLKCIDVIRTLPLQKTTNMISNLKARSISHKNGFDDALMTDNGLVTEGATWNIFFGNGMELITPSLKIGILPGVTRRLIISLAREKRFSVKEAEISTDKLKDFSYSFVTNAAIGLASVKSIDGIDFAPECKEFLLLKNYYFEIPGELVQYFHPNSQG